MHAILLVAAVSLSALPTEGTIKLSPGYGDTLKQAGISKIAVANPDVVDVQTPGAGELLFTGKRRGRTNVTIWFKNGKTVTRAVVVDDEKQGELEKLIHESVNPVLEVKRVGDRTIVDGHVDSMEELTRLKKIVGDDPNVVLLVTLNPAVLPFVAQQITQAFRREGIREATAMAVGGKIILEGSVADEDELKKAQLIASAYYDGSPLGAASGGAGR